MNPLAILVSALVWNYRQHRKGKPTICSTCRPHVGPKGFLIGWAALTAWLAPHYIKPFYKNKENHHTHECK